jgi:hypothetical protein
MHQAPFEFGLAVPRSHHIFKRFSTRSSALSPISFDKTSHRHTLSHVRHVLAAAFPEKETRSRNGLIEGDFTLSDTKKIEAKVVPCPNSIQMAATTL